MVLQRGSLQASLDALHKSLGLSSDLEDSSGDVDVLGAIGDTYTELGDLEKAAEVRYPCGVTAVLWTGSWQQHTQLRKRTVRCPDECVFKIKAFTVCQGRLYTER